MIEIESSPRGQRTLIEIERSQREGSLSSAEKERSQRGQETLKELKRSQKEGSLSSEEREREAREKNKRLSERKRAA